jgi:hypothetical protein
MDFELRRDDLHRTRFTDSDPPEPGDGQAQLRVESFGLTTNNITYAIFGDAMSYWDFFPGSEQGWGRMPVWGFAHVSESRHPDLPEGTRVYGYLPPSTGVVVVPDRVDERGFVDAAPHRAPLPSAYQGYRRVDADPVHRDDREHEQILFWPLFYTSYLIDDFLADEDFWGADTIVLSSASSKTAIIAAYLLAQREGIELVGLTSPRNSEFVEELKVYDAIVTYDAIDSLPGDRAVYVDMSGDGGVRSGVHDHYGHRLAHSAMVGMTHWDKMAQSGDLPGPKPIFFFAPDRIRKRGSDWGTAKLDASVAEAWHPFADWAGGWIEVERVEGNDEIERVYLQLLDGEIDPKTGHVVSLPG